MTLDKIMESLQIFRRYYDGDDYVIHCEHDKMHGPMLSELREKGLTDEEYERLQELGWREGEYDCLSAGCSC